MFRIIIRVNNKCCSTARIKHRMRVGRGRRLGPWYVFINSQHNGEKGHKVHIKAISGSFALCQRTTQGHCSCSKQLLHNTSIYVLTVNVSPPSLNWISPGSTTTTSLSRSVDEEDRADAVVAVVADNDNVAADADDDEDDDGGISSCVGWGPECCSTDVGGARMSSEGDRLDQAGGGR